MGKIIMSGIVNPLVTPSNLPPIGTALNNMTYEQISAISNAGVAADYFSIGDVKEVTLNGALGTGLTFSNTKAYMQILAFDHNKDVEMTGESHILFGFGKSALSGGKDICFVDSVVGSPEESQYLNMNTSNVNTGGWNSSKMRTVICAAFKSSLPSELQSILRSRTIYTDNTGGSSSTSSDVTTTIDEIYIPAEFEVFGTISRSNTTEQTYQKQLTYYVSGNSKIRYMHNSSDGAVYWWLRSPNYGRGDYFCCVHDNGNISSTYAFASYGFVPLITI